MNYQTDNFWMQMQAYLPPHNRLANDTPPQEYFIDYERFSIHLDHYLHPKPKGRLLLLHGVGGNGRLLSFIAEPLHRAGYDVICPDLPLYGCTGYSGTITYADWVDVAKMLVHRFSDISPLFVFGLSAGGLLAYQAACGCAQVRGIIATCVLDQRDAYITKKTAVNPLLGAIAPPFLKAAAKLLPELRLPMKAIANMKRISNNKEVSNLLMRDEKSAGIRVPLSFAATMISPELETEPEDFTQCPFLLVHPEADYWTDVSLSLRFFKKLACPKTLRMLEGAGHFPIEQLGLEQLERYILDFTDGLCADTQG